jgi:hypothetical protein
MQTKNKTEFNLDIFQKNIMTNVNASKKKLINCLEQITNVILS